MMRTAALFVAFAALEGTARADDAAEAAEHRAIGRALYAAATTPDELLQACAAFEASLAIENDAGTLQRLAVCYQKLGRLGAAWRTFSAARAAARAIGFTELEGYARDNLLALRPARLVIAVTRTDATVSLDGMPVVREAIGDTPDELGAVGIALDAGPHQIRATAPGASEFETAITAIDGEQTRVVVTLVAEPPATAPVPPGIDVRPRSSHRRRAGWITLGASAVVGLTGVAFGYVAWSSYNDADAACPTHRGCSEQTLALDARAGRAAIVTDLAFGLAAIGAGIGTYLVITERRETRVVPLAGRGAVGLALGGGF